MISTHRCDGRGPSPAHRQLGSSRCRKRWRCRHWRGWCPGHPPLSTGKRQKFCCLQHHTSEAQAGVNIAALQRSSHTCAIGTMTHPDRCWTRRCTCRGRALASPRSRCGNLQSELWRGLLQAVQSAWSLQASVRTQWKRAVTDSRSWRMRPRPVIRTWVGGHHNRGSARAIRRSWWRRCRHCSSSLGWLWATRAAGADCAEAHAIFRLPRQVRVCGVARRLQCRARIRARWQARFHACKWIGHAQNCRVASVIACVELHRSPTHARTCVQRAAVSLARPGHASGRRAPLPVVAQRVQHLQQHQKQAMWAAWLSAALLPPAPRPLQPLTVVNCEKMRTLWPMARRCVSMRSSTSILPHDSTMRWSVGMWGGSSGSAIQKGCTQACINVGAATKRASIRWTHAMQAAMAATAWRTFRNCMALLFMLTPAALPAEAFTSQSTVSRYSAGTQPSSAMPSANLSAGQWWNAEHHEHNHAVAYGVGCSRVLSLTAADGF